MKFFCPVPGESWIIDRMISEYITYSRHNIITNNKLVTTLDDVGIDDNTNVFLMAPFVWRQLFPNDRHLLQQKKFIVFLHHIVPSKFNLEDFLERDKYVNHYIVPNIHTYNDIKQYTSKPITQLSYWINEKDWQATDRQATRKALNIENQFVIASFQRDTEGDGCDGDNPQPKLEKGPDKIVECILRARKEIDNVHVLLSGWRRQYIIHELKKHNVYYTYVERPILSIINALYDASDLYIMGSRYEGGAQCVLEAPYKKIPIISTDCGMASQILHPNCVFDVSEKFYLPTLSDMIYAHKNVLELTIEKQVKKLDDILEGICKDDN